MQSHVQMSFSSFQNRHLSAELFEHTFGVFAYQETFCSLHLTLSPLHKLQIVYPYKYACDS